MIDTVRLSGNYYISDSYIYDDLWTSNYLRPRPDGIDEEVFLYRKKGDPLKIEYYAQVRRLYVEVSIPKFLYGHNVTMVSDSDIQRFYIKLDNVLRNKFHAESHSDFRPWYWTVQRMDVCWNFQVGGDVPDYITAFRNIHIPKYTTHTYGDSETVQWLCSTKQIKFYDKEREVRRHGGALETIDLAKGILRFEAEIKAKSGKLLQKYSEFRWAGELLRESVAKELLLYHLQKLKLDRSMTVSNKLEVVGKLQNVYGINTAQKLLGFMEYINLMGKEALDKPSKSTYSRNLKMITDLGIAPMFSDKDLPPLDLTPLTA